MTMAARAIKKDLINRVWTFFFATYILWENRAIFPAAIHCRRYFAITSAANFIIWAIDFCKGENEWHNCGIGQRDKVPRKRKHRHEKLAKFPTAGTFDNFLHSNSFRCVLITLIIRTANCMHSALVFVLATCSIYTANKMRKHRIREAIFSLLISFIRIIYFEIKLFMGISSGIWITHHISYSFNYEAKNAKKKNYDKINLKWWY